MTIKLATHNSPEYWQAVDLRRQILRLPLGLDFTPEELANEANDLNLIALDDHNLLVATLSLVDLGSHKIKMRQVAVADNFQGTGIGSKLVIESEREARARGFDEMQLHARDTAVPFYQRLAYQVVGEEFTEVGIPHRKMSKMLI